MRFQRISVVIGLTLVASAVSAGKNRVEYRETKLLTNCDGKRKVERGSTKGNLVWELGEGDKVRVTLLKGGSAPDPVLEGAIRSGTVNASGKRTVVVFGRESTTHFELKGRLDEVGNLREGTLKTYNARDPSCWFETSIRVK